MAGYVLPLSSQLIGLLLCLTVFGALHERLTKKTLAQSAETYQNAFALQLQAYVGKKVFHLCTIVEKHHSIVQATRVVAINKGKVSEHNIFFPYFIPPTIRGE